MPMKTPLRELSGLFQPANLLLAGLTYSLGIAIARYLGISLDLVLLFVGGFFILCAIAVTGTLNSYFAPDYLFPKNIEDLQERNAILRLLFYCSIALLGICSIVFFYLILQQHIQPATLFLCAAFVLIALLISVPPVRLIDKGYGEIAQAVMIGGLPAIIAFMLQADSIHRMVGYFSFSILLLSLSYLLITEFPDYAIDLKYKHQSLLIRLTWQRAIPVHNIIMIGAYIFFVAAPLVGIPLSLSWAPLLTIPLAIYQIVILRNIELGLKPNWRVLRVNALAMVGLATYLLTFTFWIR
jgi:1,4-dihydroxy-2-naphthoate octaprenyltransferase